MKWLTTQPVLHMKFHNLHTALIIMATYFSLLYGHWQALCNISSGSNGLDTKMRTILNAGNLTMVLLTLVSFTLNINEDIEEHEMWIPPYTYHFPPSYHCDHNTSLHPETNNYHHIESLNITITSTYGKFPIIWHVQGMGSVSYMNLLVEWENSYRNAMHSKNSMFLFYLMHGSLHGWQSKLMCKRVQIQILYDDHIFN